MPLSVQTNLYSLAAQNALSTNTANLAQSFEQLSTGYKINSAADDAAGLAIVNTLTGQINGQNQAAQNTQQGINLVQIADGALATIQNNLQRIRELAVQAANDTNGSSQRTSIKDEIASLKTEIDQIANSTTFNGKHLLNASAPTTYRIQVGANHTASQDTINIGSGLGNAKASALGLGSVAVSTNSAAETFLATVDTALNNLSTKRATLGAEQNRLTAALGNLSSLTQNYTSARSGIQDTDIAAATASLTRNQILQQAAASVLVQANQAPSLALKLIG